MDTTTEARLHAHLMHILLDYTRQECHSREYVSPVDTPTGRILRAQSLARGVALETKAGQLLEGAA